MGSIEIFTDGSSLGNPGKGGLAAIMKLKGTSYQKIITAGYQKTTNNRMELLAVILAMEEIKKPSQIVNIYSDSLYVIHAFEKGWIYGWIKKSFAKVKNADLWIRLNRLIQAHQVQFHWVKGHAGHPENETCDRLAKEAANMPSLKIDHGYLQQFDSNL